jgi:CDP-glucose 4,6-dehydratase
VGFRKGTVEGLVTQKLRRAYAGKKVLVTGHTGFKGSWLCLWLSELGADVVGYALKPRGSDDNYVASKVDRRIRHIQGDVRDFPYLMSIFRAHNPEFVFHLAAQALVRDSYNSPKETFDINVGGTVNLLECCRQTESVHTVINVTSDKCYDNKNWIWGYRENDPMGGYDPYSSSKGCSELITSSYRDSFFNPDTISYHRTSLSSARAGNVIGGGDWAKDRIVPDSIRSLLQRNTIIMRNPRSIRPWQHVLEPLSGYLYLAASMYEQPGGLEGAWNFGPERDAFIPVETLVNSIIKHWGSGECEDIHESDGLHEAGLLALDTSKARFRLGWKSMFGFDDAVKYTVEWYKMHEAGADMAAFSRNQIRMYMERMDGSY